MTERITRTPFKEELQPLLKGKALYVLGSYPDYVIRSSFGLPLKEDLEDLEVSREVFSRMQSYGIAVVPHQFVLGGVHKKHHTIFTIADKVEGEDFRNAAIPTKEADRFLANVCTFLFDTYTNNGSYMNDMVDPSQYVWGTTKRDSKKRIYFVDLDLDPETVFKGEDFFFDNLSFLYKMICTFEQNNNNKRLSEARKKLVEFCLWIKSNEDCDHAREVAESILGGGNPAEIE